MKLKLRNVTVEGRRTSLRLDQQTWNNINEILSIEHMTLQEFVKISIKHFGNSNITCAVRSSVLEYYREATPKDRSDKRWIVQALEEAVGDR